MLNSFFYYRVVSLPSVCLFSHGVFFFFQGRRVVKRDSRLLTLPFCESSLLECAAWLLAQHWRDHCRPHDLVYAVLWQSFF